MGSSGQRWDQDGPGAARTVIFRLVTIIARMLTPKVYKLLSVCAAENAILGFRAGRREWFAAYALR